MHRGELVDIREKWPRKMLHVVTKKCSPHQQGEFSRALARACSNLRKSCSTLYSGDCNVYECLIDGAAARGLAVCRLSNLATALYVANMKKALK
jgi:hypothetical protein